MIQRKWSNEIVCFQNDDLRKKLSDFERVNKAQNSLNDHSSNLEQEIKRLKQK